MRTVNADKEACGVGIYPGITWYRTAFYAGLLVELSRVVFQMHFSIKDSSL
jgi:hypothetical protein